jgi:hypothetical protein
MDRKRAQGSPRRRPGSIPSMPALAFDAPVMIAWPVSVTYERKRATRRAWHQQRPDPLPECQGLTFEAPRRAGRTSRARHALPHAQRRADPPGPNPSMPPLPPRPAARQRAVVRLARAARAVGPRHPWRRSRRRAVVRARGERVGEEDAEHNLASRLGVRARSSRRAQRRDQQPLERRPPHGDGMAFSRRTRSPRRGRSGWPRPRPGWAAPAGRPGSPRRRPGR